MNDNKLKKKSESKILLESLIDNFREELKEINPENLDHLPHTYNFEFPCQIELFWLDAALQYQILIITHEIDGSDKEIIINGPYYNKEFLDKIKIV